MSHQTSAFGGRRVRLRTMILVVAGVSLLLFAGSMLWRRHRYQEAAALHASLERQSRDEGRFWFVDSGRVQTLGESDPQALSAYHGLLKEKYRKAANRPWRIVEPDTPARDLR